MQILAKAKKALIIWSAYIYPFDRFGFSSTEVLRHKKAPDERGLFNELILKQTGLYNSTFSVRYPRSGAPG
jgi:hypothetical protein